MAFTLFLGCNIPARVRQYEMSAKAICRMVDIQFEEVPEFVCCGYPMRNIDESAFLLSAAKNIALSEQCGQDIMTLCKCCFGSLKIARHHLETNPELKDQVNEKLLEQGLVYQGKARIRHFLSVLHEDIGIKKIKELVSKKYKKLNIAASVGCHALRPSKITRFDDPGTPSVFDDLVKLTGAKSIDWSRKVECCGAPLLGINDELATDLMKDKINSAIKAGADYMAVACPWTFLMFDQCQIELKKEQPKMEEVMPVLYSQLLGLSMGLDKKQLGFGENQFDINSLESYLVADRNA